MSGLSAPAHNRAFVSMPDDGAPFGVAGDVMIIRARGADTGGSLCLVEARVPPGGGPPRHVHRREAESFFVLEGEITFLHPDGSTRLGPGGFVHLPKNTPHAFQNQGDIEARMLVWCTPAGFEHMVERAGTPLPDRHAPAPPPTPDDFATLRNVCDELEISFVD